MGLITPGDVAINMTVYYGHTVTLWPYSDTMATADNMQIADRWLVARGPGRAVQPTLALI